MSREICSDKGKGTVAEGLCSSIPWIRYVNREKKETDGEVKAYVERRERAAVVGFPCCQRTGKKALGAQVWDGRWLAGLAFDFCCPRACYRFGCFSCFVSTSVFQLDV